MFDKNLTRPDYLVLQNLSADLKDQSSRNGPLPNGSPSSNAHLNGHMLHGKTPPLGKSIHIS